MKKIVWRLKESPSTDKLSQLVKDGILTKDEAREILFSSEEQTERDVKSLEAEIKFLRELVDKLAKRSEIMREIEVIRPIYIREPWIKPYITWCGNSTITLDSGNLTGTGEITFTNSSFSDITTF